MQKLTIHADTNDLPIIAIKAKKTKEAITNLVDYYREFTGGISGLKNQQSQADRLSRALELWKKVEQTGHDTIILGDINLDYKEWAKQTSSQRSTGASHPDTTC